MIILLFFIIAPFLIEYLSSGGLYSGTEEEFKRLIQKHYPVYPNTSNGMRSTWYSGYYSKGASIFKVFFIHTRIISKYHFLDGQLIPNKYNHIIESIGEKENK